MNEIKEKIKDLELALNYVCYDADLIPKLQTVWQKLELLHEVVNKNDLLPDVSNSYCVRRHMFFAVTNPIMEENLTKEEAEILCKKLNDEELDDTYVHYEVHNCC